MTDRVRKLSASRMPASGNHTESVPFCHVNGLPRVRPSCEGTLLDWLREELELDDARPACETGHCGACAVLMNGRAVKACSVLACEAEDGEVLTLTALSKKSGSAVQAVLNAMHEQRAFQCGYCVSAFVLAAVELLERLPKPTEDDVRCAFDGLLCRCTGYQSIVDAVLLAARTVSAGKSI